ncbi:MAG: zinc dependent phospholipase C family protein [Campylobacterota bacterium]
MWVGQEVINDLEDDGQLTFMVDKKDIEIEVPADVRDAILNNKSTYLMGTIGPDAVPDVVAGQMVVHPGGIEDGVKLDADWYSSVWLEYLLRKTEDGNRTKAFAYGYLTHAATDVFSHTYVNQYSGDVFELLYGAGLESEYRHIKLEQYIADRTPPLRNLQGELLGDYRHQIALDQEYGKFVRDTLIYDEEIQNQYERINGGRHLWTITELRTGVDDLANDSIWAEIDEAILQMITIYYGLNLTDEDLARILELAQQIIDSSNLGIDALQGLTNELYGFLAKIDDVRFAHLATAVAELKSLEQQHLSTLQEAREKLTELVPIPDPCPLVPIPYIKCKGPICWPDVMWVEEPVCKTQRLLNDQILDAVEELENRAMYYRYDYFERAEDIRQEARLIGDALVLIHDLLTDLAQILNSETSPIKGLLLSWRDDIDEAMGAYGVAMSKTMVNTMRKDSISAEDVEEWSTCEEGSLVGTPIEEIREKMENLGCELQDEITDLMARFDITMVQAIERQKFYEPAQEWFECYSGQLQGIPSELSGCEMRDSVETIKDSLSDIFALLDAFAVIGESIGLPSRQSLEQLQDQLLDNVQATIEEQALEYLEEQSGIYFDEIFLSKGLTDEQLQGVFNETYLGQVTGLMPIPDVAQRVKLEMGISEQDIANEEEFFDPETYTVAYDSVVLSKLALLDVTGVKQLIDQAGLIGSDYNITVDNIVASFIGSLDGHHQWQEHPPRLPSNNDINCTQHKEISYRAGVQEFILYEKVELRTTLFMNMFVGAIAQGLAELKEITTGNVVAPSPQTWIELKKQKDPTWRAVRDEWLENKASIRQIEDLNITEECRTAYFPSSTWIKLK